MPDTLAVTNYQRITQSSTTTISADVGEIEVWFRGKAFAEAPERADPFLATALIPAMFAGATLDLRHLPPVSATLMANLDQIQDIWTCWNPELKRVAVLANVAPDLPRSTSGTATFFSGGVDAVHAVLTGAGPGERLVFINGFDFIMTARQWSQACARVARLAEKLGGEFVPLETNWHDFNRRHRLARSTSHGGCLAALAHLMAPPRMTVASSFSWSWLLPWGTHPLLDPLWSNGATEIRHFGCDAFRSEKVALIAQRPELLEELWVCHEDPLENCGRCIKCCRTMAVLKLYNIPIRGFKATDGDPVDRYLHALLRKPERAFFSEFTAAVRRDATDPTMIKRVESARRAFARRAALRQLLDFVAPARRAKQRRLPHLRPAGYDPLPDR